MTLHNHRCDYCGGPIVEIPGGQWTCKDRPFDACQNEVYGEPLRCRECGADLIVTTCGLVCPHGHGRIQPGGYSQRAAVKGADLKAAGNTIADYLRQT